MSVYAAYAFDEGGGTTITDYSGAGRNMTITGSNSWITPGEGAYATAFQAGASGSDGAVWNNGSTIAALSGDVTLQFWYLHTAATSTTLSHAGGLYRSAGTAALAGYSYRNRTIGSSPHYTIRDSAGTIIDVGVSGTVADSSWHNTALVYHSTGTMDEYLDGVLLSPTVSPTTTNPIGTTVTEIGAGSVLSLAAAQAAVQDMRVFDTALTGADVVTWMNTPVHPAGVSPVPFSRSYNQRTAETYRFSR